MELFNGLILSMILILILLSGCGKKLEHTDIVGITAPITVDATFKPYLSKFLADTGISPSGISVIFFDLPRPSVGRCTVYNDNSRVINIDRTFWQYASEDRREATMYHELGHCALDLPHNNLLLLGCPVSVMHENMPDYGTCYGLNKAYYHGKLASHK